METGEPRGIQAWLRELDTGDAVSIQSMSQSARPDVGEVFKVTETQIFVIRAANKHDVAREIKFDRASGLSVGGSLALAPHNPQLQERVYFYDLTAFLGDTDWRELPIEALEEVVAIVKKARGLQAESSRQAGRR